MKKIILILAIIPMITLGQVYTYEDYDDIHKLREELLDCEDDLFSAGKMDYIDNFTARCAHDLFNHANSSFMDLEHVSSLVYIYTLIGNVDDKIRVASFVKEKIGHIIKGLEIKEETITGTLFFIDNTYLVICGDKLKGIIKKAIMKLKSLELRTE
jgi:hypothetical protein